MCGGKLLDLNFSLWLRQFQMPALLPLGTPQWLSAPHTLLTALIGRQPPEDGGVMALKALQVTVEAVPRNSKV